MEDEKQSFQCLEYGKCKTTWSMNCRFLQCNLKEIIWKSYLQHSPTLFLSRYVCSGITQSNETAQHLTLMHYSTSLIDMHHCCIVELKHHLLANKAYSYF